MTRAVLSLLLLVVACRAKEAPPATSGSGRGTASAPSAVVVAEPAGSGPTTEASVAAFWKWFAEHAAALHDDKELPRVMEQISAELAKVKPGVFAEIGTDGDERMLVISADGISDLFPTVQSVYAARPTVKGWKVVAFRPRSAAGLAIEMGGKKVAPADVKFASATTDGKLDISVFIPGFDNSDAAKQMAFILLDHVVGEYDMETKIGSIELAALDKAPATAKPLPALAAAVDATH